LSFVDTNLLIDSATNNPAWAHWSRQTLIAARARGPLLINAIVYAESAIPFESQTDRDAVTDYGDHVAAIAIVELQTHRMSRFEPPALPFIQ
jgi:hypothetical protein